MGRLKTGLTYLLLNLVLHLPFLHLAPVSTHVWRQCNTLAMSRNFAEESMNILEPRIDRRNETNGVTGSHFPLYEWSLACIYKVFTPSDYIPRLYSAFIFSLSMLAIYLICLQIGVDHKFSFWAGLLLLSIPQFYYDSINAMPDILALTLALFAWVFLFDGLKNEKKSLWGLGLALSVLAGMVKLQFLIIPLTLSYTLVFERKLYWRASLLFLTIGPVLAWYRYAQKLTEVNNLKEYGLWIKPIRWSEKLQTLKWNLLSDLPELLLGWPFFLALLALIVLRGIKLNRSRFFSIALLWLLGFDLFYLLAIERMKHHSYYFMVVLPVFVLLFVYGIRQIKNGLRFLIMVSICNMFWAGLRIIPSRWTPAHYQVPAEFIDAGQRRLLSEMVPSGEKVVIGPDLSGCVYFYFTKTRGYSFAEFSELSEKQGESVRLEEMRKQGVKFLLFQRNENADLALSKIINKSFVKRIGDFELWKLE